MRFVGCTECEVECVCIVCVSRVFLCVCAREKCALLCALITLPEIYSRPVYIYSTCHGMQYSCGILECYKLKLNEILENVTIFRTASHIFIIQVKCPYSGTSVNSNLRGSA